MHPTRWFSFGLLLLIATTARAAERPNVVFIISDDQGWNDYSFMGHEHIRTPHLDKLATQSRMFTRGYVPTSLCRPSLASMMTGLWPHQHGVTGNDPSPDEGKDRDRKDPAFLAKVRELNSSMDKFPTIAKALGALGYLSYQTGKWWEGDPKTAGFTESMTSGDPTLGGRHGDEGLKIGRESMQPMYDFMERAHAENKPFFLWYAPMLPHSPHNPPQRLLDKYLKVAPNEAVARYWAMVDWFDETCGQLLDWLDEKQLADNTIIVYVVDNGWIQSPVTNKFAAGSKLSPNEGGMRTPIMIRWPGHVAPQMDEQRLAISLDILPTLVAACESAEIVGLPGINLLDNAAVSQRKTLYGATYTHNVKNITDPVASLRYRWIIDGNDKLIVPNDTWDYGSWFLGVRPELYDVVADPGEEHNLYRDRPERVQELTGKLDAWWDPQQRASTGH